MDKRYNTVQVNLAEKINKLLKISLIMLSIVGGGGGGYIVSAEDA